MIQVPATPSFRLDGRRALVTGAGRGLGFAMAAALAEAGAEVVLAARGRDEVEAAAQALRDLGRSTRAFALDVADRAALRAMLDEAGTPHVFVNNAGTNRPAAFLDVVEEDYDVVTDLNVRAAFFAAQEVASRMVSGGVRGSIVNVSSQMGHVGGPRRTVYCATKHAMEGFTKAMALELAPHGIRVNTLCPTFILTEMTRSTLADPDMRRMIEDKIALGRVGRPEDVMGPVVFLASEASSLMTGAALVVDGGWTAA